MHTYTLVYNDKHRVPSGLVDTPGRKQYRFWYKKIAGSQTNPYLVGWFQKDGWEFSRGDRRLLPTFNSEDCQPVPAQTFCLRAGDFMSRDLSYRLPHSSHTDGDIHNFTIIVMFQSCFPTALKTLSCCIYNFKKDFDNGKTVLVMVYWKFQTLLQSLIKNVPLEYRYIFLSCHISVKWHFILFIHKFSV